MRLFAVAVFVALFAAPALAETCPQGQVKNEDTRDHCCWPNQVWSTKRATCVGIPACPAPMVAQGETCKAAEAAAQPPAAALPDQAKPVAPPPATTQPVQAQPVQPQPVQAKPVQAQPVQPQPAQPPPAQAQPAPTKTEPPVQAQPVPAKAVQAQPVQAAPVPAPPPVLQPGYAPGTVFVPVTPMPATRQVHVRQPGKIITGAFLIALAIGAIGSSVPLWQDAVDDGDEYKKHLTGHDAAAIGGALVLDVAGVVMGAIGGSVLASGIRGKRIDVPLAFAPEPIHGRVAKVEVALAF